MSKQSVNILCMKWGDKYGPDYVNRLYSMVSRNLQRPFRFICFTDDSDGVIAEVDCLPILEVGADLNDAEGLKRVQAWKKLTTLANPLYDIEGTCLFLDLDVVIVDNIDCFFEPEGEFLIIREWEAEDIEGNSSVYRFEATRLHEVLDYFIAHRDEIVANYINEQLYLTKKIEELGKLGFWPGDWCPSYRRHCLPKNRLARWFRPSKKPNNAKIIIFHGAPNPEEAIIGKGDRWYRQICPAPWVADYWK